MREVKPLRQVLILPYDKKITIEDGEILLKGLVEAGIIVDTPCGGRGTCGKCAVLLTTEKLEDGGDETARWGKVLACKYVVTSDLTIKIEKQILAEVRKGKIDTIESRTADSRIKKYFLSLEEDGTKSDEELILENLAKISEVEESNFISTLGFLRKLPKILREAEYKVSIVTRSDQLLDIEEGDTREKLYGVAFDIGTTSIVGTLINLESGKVLCSESIDNPQRIHGADVITRISYVQREENGLAELQKLIIDGINQIIDKIIHKSGISREYIYEVVLVGNTTMQHLLLGISPENLALAPYLPAYKKIREIKARELGIAINLEGVCIVAPNIAGYVGGDTIAAVLATDFLAREPISLLVDIGTNGEIVLGSREKGFLACSAAAGPAFEGAHIKFGKRAAPGAIEEVKISKDGVQVKTIANYPANGICGSGIVDAIAEMLTVGLVDFRGKLLDASQFDFAPDLKRRSKRINNENCFVLSFGEENQIGEDIVITQRDIRELQLAKGAILAGIKILGNFLEIQEQEIEAIYLAGAFGTYISKENAIKIGILPPIEIDKVISVGNAAGAGSEIILTTKKGLTESINISTRIEYIELSKVSNFDTEFLNCLNFPRL